MLQCKNSQNKGDNLNKLPKVITKNNKKYNLVGLMYNFPETEVYVYGHNEETDDSLTVWKNKLTGKVTVVG